MRQFAQVRYPGVAPGIDLVFHCRHGGPEMDLEVAAGADPRAFHWRLGGRPPQVSATGDLVFPSGLRLHRPEAFQDARIVASAWHLRGQRIYFEVGPYDRQRPLLIDPRIGFLSYYGSSGIDQVNAVAVDAAGSVLITGTLGAGSLLFPGGISRPPNAISYVTKLNASATAVIWTVFTTATWRDVQVDSVGNVWVAGSATATAPITPDAVQPNFGGATDGYLTALSGSNGGLLYASFLGNNADESINALTIDKFNNVYLCGTTQSAAFPTTANAYRRTAPGGPSDGFVAKFNTTSRAWDYVTLLGGSGIDTLTGIAVDATLAAYVTGSTTSTDYPVTPGVVGRTKIATEGSMPTNAIVTKLSASGGSLVYSTYFGGNRYDVASAIALDPASNAYLVGVTQSPTFPSTPGAFQTAYPGAQSIFVAKLNASATATVYATLFGGTGEVDDFGYDVKVDALGYAYFAGLAGLSTVSGLPPSTPLDQRPRGFVAILSPDGSTVGDRAFFPERTVVYKLATAVNPTGLRAADSALRIYFAGRTETGTLPVTPPNVVGPTGFGGATDGFLGSLTLTVPEVALDARIVINDIVVQNGQPVSQVTRGLPYEFLLTAVSAAGGRDATGIWFRDTFPADLGPQFSSIAPQILEPAGYVCEVAGSVVTCPAGGASANLTLPAGSQFVVRIPSVATVARTDTNTAEFFYRDGNVDRRAVTNAVTYTIAEPAPAGLAQITTQVTPAPLATARYTWSISNPSATPITGVDFRVWVDTKAAAVTPVGDGWRRNQVLDTAATTRYREAADALFLPIADLERAQSIWTIATPLEALGGLQARLDLRRVADPIANALPAVAAQVVTSNTPLAAASLDEPTTTIAVAQGLDFRAVSAGSAIEVVLGDDISDAPPKQAAAPVRRLFGVDPGRNTAHIQTCVGAACQVTREFALASGAKPSRILSPDFNNDGLRDILTLNAGTNSVTAIITARGTRTLTESPVGGRPLAGAVVSGVATRIALTFAGDAATRPYVGIFATDAQGRLTAATLDNQPIRIPVGNLPNFLLAQDLNGDNVPDLVVANAGSRSVQVLRGLASGSFSSVNTIPVEDGPSAVAAGDWNGDGIPDLAIANSLSNTVSIVLGSASGTFGGANNIRVGNAPVGLAVLDLNQDLARDLAVACFNSDEIVYLLSDGRGGFRISGGNSTGRGPARLLATDFDGDGGADLFVTNGVSATSMVLVSLNGPVKPAAVVNAASYSKGAAPGSLISIFGTGLAQRTEFASTVPLPTSLGAATVTINGRAVPLIYASPTQINAQLPFALAPGTYPFTIGSGVTLPNRVDATVQTTAPGIFQYGATRAVAINADGRLNTVTNPARTGTIITVYMTGQGAVDNAVATGAEAPASPLSRPLAAATATIGNRPATIDFIGLTPGSVGLLQANIRVPAGVTGEAPLVVTLGGVPSNAAIVTVAP